MKHKLLNVLLLSLLWIGYTYAQMERPNVIWARQTTETIILDGQLNESAWDDAESFRMKVFENTQYIPGSGNVQERGSTVTDPLDVTLKFLVNGNTLYMAADVKDKSVGGGLFNQFDGFLMNMRNRAEQNPGGIAPPFEYFYGWVTEGWADPATGEVGASPGFFGWAGGHRDSTDSRTGLTNGEVWNAVTVVNGTTNDDTTPDDGYTVEFMFNLDVRGYDVSDGDGDVIEFNLSIYDTDNAWGPDSTANPNFSCTRTWWQGPWGNNSSYDLVRIYSRPDVTTSSGSVPQVGPEMVVPNGMYHHDPVIDGVLDEDVWGAVDGFDIRYGDDDLRASYPAIGPYRSGQFQPDVNGGKAAVVDPGDVTVKMFFKGNKLYLGADFRDQAVWGNAAFDQWDGIRYVINDRFVQRANGSLEAQQLTAVIDTLGNLRVADYLAALVDSGSAQAAMALKGATTVNDFNDVDEGYQIEICIDLTALGYPVGLGDGVLFFSATLFDGENFENESDSYGTRTWFYRESAAPAAPAWAFMDYADVIPAPSEPEISVLERPNVIWARQTSESITLDGNLNESAWDNAESFRMRVFENTQFIPGSGNVQERGSTVTDPLDVTLKFLVNGNTMYMAAEVQDQSVGGGLFNQFDGFLMNMRNRAEQNPGGIAPPFEYFYGWVTEGWADPATGEVGASPGFFGWAGGHRDSIDSRTGLTNGEVWNAVTVVNGITNDDSEADDGYTVEFMFNLTARGYDVTDGNGDIIEFNLSIYDTDNAWGPDSTANPNFSCTRTWWQGPWGNNSSYDLVRIYSRPDVTTSSGPVPRVGPEMVIRNGANYDDPVIDGVMDESVWADVEGFDIRYGDDELRSSYPAIGPYRSGQFQPDVNGGKAAVVDPGDVTVKMFFKGNNLYIGADFRDQAVWGNAAFDQWDGIRFIINDRKLQRANGSLEAQQLTAVIDTLGNLRLADLLSALVDSGSAEAAMALKGATTVNDFNDVDEGYQIEICINLTELGYPVGLGDGVLFFSATMFDGENFENEADSYGTRTWFYRESAAPAAPAWVYMDSRKMVGDVTALPGQDIAGIPTKFEILGNYPNPFNPTTRIQYTLPKEGIVTLNVFDVLGRKVTVLPMGYQPAGLREVQFSGAYLSTGLYFYNLEVKRTNSREVSRTKKMLLIK